MMVDVHANRALEARLEHVQDYDTALVELSIRRLRSNLARLSVTSARGQAAAARILGNSNNRVTFAQLHPATFWLQSHDVMSLSTKRPMR
jgi:hypothetical protein